MSVTVMCPNLRCRRILAVPETCRGRRVRCSYCKTVFMVPFHADKVNSPIANEIEAGQEAAGGGKKA